MRNPSILWLAALLLAFMCGCSTLETPPVKDLSLLKIGTPRSALSAELGEPLSDVKEKQAPAGIKGSPQGDWLLAFPGRSPFEPKPPYSKIDVFVFIQGYTRDSKKTGNDNFYDLAESGSWKRIATPAQANFYKDLVCIVKYDANDNILTVQTFQRVSQNPGSVQF